MKVTHLTLSFLTKIYSIKPLTPVLRKIKNFLFNPIIYRGSSVNCPICNWKGGFFKNGEICPNCDSRERHRLIYLFLKEKLPKNKTLNLLHFSPERSIRKFLKSYKNITTVSADIAPEIFLADRKEDIREMTFKDNSFDVILCSHVLEHVKEDLMAMKELRRVLKRTGFAILQVPIDSPHKTKTFEDPRIQPKDYLKFYGQPDHVRRYGLDYGDRLKKAGFKLTVIDFVSKLPAEDAARFGLDKNEKIYFCEKE
jgi:SAM-dependent methyltransferase